MKFCCFVFVCSLLTSSLWSDVQLPNLFSDHMVLQRNQKNAIWGWADQGEKVSVSIAGQNKETVADEKGNWKIVLDSMKAGGPYKMTVKSLNSIEIEDVLIGEVWLCSGQSNMGWSMNKTKDCDLETLTTKLPNVRFINVPLKGLQEPRKDFSGSWRKVEGTNIKSLSGVAFFFAKNLHTALDVPVGLVSNAWGGSSCESWIRRDLLEADPEVKPLMDRWVQTEKTFNWTAVNAKHLKNLAKWKLKVAEAKKNGKPAPRRPRGPRNPITGQHRPANCYNGMLKPVMGYGIRGAIWYQGESNASRGFQYRKLFPLMISSWRKEWDIGDFPFYWVQLADFRKEVDGPAESTWAELREAQTMTLKLPNTGEAVIIDTGDGKDIHPQNKRDVGNRLARIALARDYGFDIAYQSPRFSKLEEKNGKLVISFDHVKTKLIPFDTWEVKGFAIAGEDKKFVWANAKVISKNQVEVWSDKVKAPKAVRYAWADNPECNLFTQEWLPVTPFRSDDWPGITVGKH